MYQRKKLIPKKYDSLIKERINGVSYYSARTPAEMDLWCEMMWKTGGYGHPVGRLSPSSRQKVIIPRPAETDPKPW